MLLENLVTRRVSEENASNSSLTRRVTKQGHLLLAALEKCGPKPTCFLPNRLAGWGSNRIWDSQMNALGVAKISSLTEHCGLVL